MKIAVIVGGRSGEHEISRRTGRAILEALDALAYEATEWVLTRDGRSIWNGNEGTFSEGVAALEAYAPDCALIGMHGSDGEDGKIQALLELLDIPYQGSGVTASAVCMDKGRTKDVYRRASLPVAEDVTLTQHSSVDVQAIMSQLGLPLVLKTAESGSSVGVEVAETAEQLEEIIPRLLSTSESLVIEQWLSGAEFTSPILETSQGELVALPIIEIRPQTAAFFDYEAKYTPGATDEICPAPIDDTLAGELQTLGLAAHRALGCRHYSRTDFKLDADGNAKLLETNTLPGLTPASLFPKASEAYGMRFPELIKALVTLACNR